MDFKSEKIGITRFRGMKVSLLEKLDHPLEVCAWTVGDSKNNPKYGNPVAVVLPYKMYLDIQVMLLRADSALERLTHELPSS